MRTIYLIRHGEPLFPHGERFCLSRTDLPLSPVGRMQGVLLRHWLADKPVSAVFHSELTRAAETAAFLSQRPKMAAELYELGVGQWEGLSFQRIRAEYPAIYARRAEDPVAAQIPGGEVIPACRDRVLRTFNELLEGTEGDLAVVAHAGVNRILLCDLLGRPLKQFLTIPQPYGCVNILRLDRERLTVQEIGIRPRPALDDALCRELLAAANTPQRVQRHCEAAAKKAGELAQRLSRAGLALDMERLRSAALLHDIARAERDHAAVGAGWLTALGYPEIAELVAAHHELHDAQEAELAETSILYLADKLIREDQEVTLAQRFAASSEKLTDPAARLAHQRRYQQAQRVSRLLEQLTGEGD